VNFFVAELGSKQLGLLHELLPTATRVGLLVNPNVPRWRDVKAAAARIGLQVDVVEASNSRDIETAFGTLVKNQDDALLVGPDAFLLTRRVSSSPLWRRGMRFGDRSGAELRHEIS
jgi:putative ABC transport system substrate-binding protein